MKDARNSFGFLNFGHWNLFVVWDLLFGISANSTTPLTDTSSITDPQTPTFTLLERNPAKSI
jgi:hypothetical protein